MARRPPHYCQYPHCPAKLTSSALLCDKHRKPRHGSRHAMYDDPAYKANRAEVMARATVCEICGRPGTPTDPLVCDHIDPRGPGIPSNLRATHRSYNIRRRNSPQPYCTGTRKPAPGEANPFFRPLPPPPRRRPPDLWIG